MKQITHGTTHNKKGHIEKIKINKLPIWPIISPFLAENPWDWLKSLIKKSNTYTIPRHYHILTNPQTHKPNTKPNPQLTNTQTKYQT